MKRANRPFHSSSRYEGGIGVLLMIRYVCFASDSCTSIIFFHVLMSRRRLVLFFVSEMMRRERRRVE